MPRNIRMLIDSVVIHNYAHGTRVTVEGTEVPTGQRVPDPGEAANMSLEEFPFNASVGIPDEPAGARDIRRLLWAAFLAVLQEDTITLETLQVLLSRLLPIRLQMARNSATETRGQRLDNVEPLSEGDRDYRT